MNLPELVDLNRIYTRSEALTALGWTADQFRLRLRCFPNFDADQLTGRQLWRLARWSLPRGSLPPTPARDPNTRLGVIYVIQGLANSPVKIGFTTSDAEARQRLAELQTGNPHPLRVIAATQGTFQDEQRAHKALAAERLMGEWFDLSGRTKAFIDRLRLNGLADAIAAIIDLPAPDVPTGWDRLFIVEARIASTFTLKTRDLLLQARSAGNGPTFTAVQMNPGPIKRYYRLDHLKRWLDANGHLYRIDPHLWAASVVATDWHKTDTAPTSEKFRGAQVVGVK